MGDWPNDDLTNDHLDQTSDDPSQARAELNSAVLKIKAIIAGAVSISTALTVVLRDASGNFAAAIITAVKFVGDIAANDGTVILDSGTDGSDATLTADVEGDVTGSLLGTPSAPTPIEGDDSTRVATTAFVKAALDSTTSVSSAYNARDIVNGDFANGLTDWIVTEYTGGTVEVSTTAALNGAQSVLMTNVDSNGGGDILSESFVTGGEPFYLGWLHNVTAAGMSCIVRINWYDKNDIALAGGDEYTDLYTNQSDGPTTTKYFIAPTVPPAAARFGRVRVYGAAPGVATTGTARFAGFSRQPMLFSSINQKADYWPSMSGAYGASAGWVTVDTDSINIPFKNVPVVLTGYAGAYDTFSVGSSTRFVVGGVASNSVSNAAAGVWVYAYLSCSVPAQSAAGTITISLQTNTAGGGSSQASLAWDSSSTMQATMTTPITLNY